MAKGVTDGFFEATSTSARTTIRLLGLARPLHRALRCSSSLDGSHEGQHCEHIQARSEVRAVIGTVQYVNHDRMTSGRSNTKISHMRVSCRWPVSKTNETKSVTYRATTVVHPALFSCCLIRCSKQKQSCPPRLRCTTYDKRTTIQPKDRILAR